MAPEILVSPIDHAAPTPGLPLQPAAEAPAPAGSTRSSGWIAATARAVGGACLRVLESPAAGTLIFTSVCLSLVWQQRKTLMPAPRRPVTRSLSMAMLQGGDKAMQRFKVTHEASREEAILKAAIDDIRSELCKLTVDDMRLGHSETTIDFVKLYARVGVVEISGKEKEAIELFEDALKKMPSERTHEKHELELLLVEMYIYQECYDKALSFPCLKSDRVSSADARVPLYLAVIYTMLKNQKEAEKNFETLRKIRSEFHGQKFFKEGSWMQLDVSDFNEFTKVVTHLRKEIQEARSEMPAAKPPESQNIPVPTDKERKETKQVTKNEIKTSAAKAPESQNISIPADKGGEKTKEVPNKEIKMSAVKAPESQNISVPTRDKGGEETK